MLVFPCAKINLGLYVLRKRADGFRDIETVLLPIPLCDALEAVIDTGVPAGELVFARSGLMVPGDPMQDLCVKAHGLLTIRYKLPGMRMHLHKAIPIGAGLGGGSSDGAHTLTLINRILDLGIGQTDLGSMTAQLGSDCTFFLRSGAHLAIGRGEVLTAVGHSLGGWWLMLINPGIHISTAEVYANTPLDERREDPALVVSGTAPDVWNGRLMNVMEDYVLRTYPHVARTKDRIQEAGAVYSAMSGSGSSVFGLFRDRPALPLLPAGQRVWVLPL